MNDLEATRNDHSTNVSVERLPPPIRLFLAVSAALTGGCLAVEAGCKWLLGWDTPYTWPLMPWAGRFRDLLLYRSRFGLFHSPEFYSFNGPAYFYPAPMAVVHWLVLKLPVTLPVFLLLLLGAIAVSASVLGRAIIRRRIPITATVFLLLTSFVCSYPIFFEAEQANLEWVVCALVAVGIVCILRDWSYCAAICFGLAGSMKFYPLILVGLLVSQRRYRETAAAFVACFVSMVASLWLACPDLTLSWHGMVTGLAGFRYWYMLRYEQVGFDHSLFALLKAAWLLCSGVELSQRALAFSLACYMLVAGFAGVVLYLDVIRKLPLVNQILCLTIATILLPPVSYDYTLLHLYAPWAVLLLVAIDARQLRTPGLTGAFVCMAVLLSPVTEFIFHGHSYGGQMKCLALVLLMAISLRRPFPLRLVAGSDPAPAMGMDNAAPQPAAQ